MEKVYFYNNHGEKLAGIIHKPAKLPAPAVIISHGFGSSKDNKDVWASQLCKADFLVLRFDFSGHGESEGNIAETTITKVTEDLRAAINFIKTLKIEKIGLTGHSMGGLASLLAAGEAGAVVAIAPPSNFPEVYEHRKKAGLDLVKWKKKGYTSLFGIRVNYSLYSDAIRYDQQTVAKSVRCPVLLVHGDKDEIIPLQQSIDLFNALKCEKRLEILKGSRHDLRMDDYAKIVEFTKQWFSRWLF